MNTARRDLRSSLLGRPNESIPTEMVSGQSSVTDLSLFTRCSDKAIDLHLRHIETRHRNGSLAVGITVVSNLPSCECCPHHGLCARLAMSCLVFVCPLFITTSSSNPVAVDMRSLSVGPSAPEKLSYLLPFCTAEHGK